MGNTQTTAKFSRLKNISCIEEILFRGGHRRRSIKKAVFKNFAIFVGKQQYWSLYLMKLTPFRPASLLKRDFTIGVFQCILLIFIYLENHLRTAASDYSFTLVIYLFSAVSWYIYKGKSWSFMVKKMFIEIRLCNPLTFFKEHVKIVEIYMVKFNVSI